MSFIYYDGTSLPRLELNRAIQMYKAFDRFWPKVTIGGTQYYDNKANFYVGNSYVESTTLKRFIKMLGMRWDTFISTDIDSQIETVYFKFKEGFVWNGERAYNQTPIEGTKPLINPTPLEVRQTLNEEFKDGEEITVTVRYGGGLGRYINAHSLTWEINENNLIQSSPLNTDTIRTTLHSNPWYYLANSHHKPFTYDSVPYFMYNGGPTEVTNSTGHRTPPNMPAAGVSSSHRLGSLALLDKNSVFEPIYNNNGSLKITNEAVSTYGTKTGEVLSYTYTLHFRYKRITTSTYLVNELMTWYDAFDEGDATTKSNDTHIKKALHTMRKIDAPWTFADVNGAITPVKKDALFLYTPTFRQWEFTGYLRVDVAKQMKKRDFVRLMSFLDTDYTIKSKQWWEDVLAAVLVVAAIIIAVATVGKGVGISAKLISLASSPAMFAAFAGTLALTLTGAAFILAKVAGLSSMGTVKIIGKFAAIIGIAGLIVGVYAAIQNLAKQALKETIKANAKTLTKTQIENIVATEYAKMSVLDVVKSAVTQALTNVKSAIVNTFTDFANQSAAEVVNNIADSLNYLLKAFDFYNQHEQKRAQDELDALKAEEEAYNQEVLNRPYTQMAGVFMLTHERLSTPDALQDLAIEMQQKVGQDANYLAWSTDVNS